MTERGFISIDGLSKHFGAVRAVDNVDLEIAQGEFFGLLGPSGCGKTTLLRMLGGFEVATAGEIHIDDEPMAAVPPNHRPVNMVFQNYAIFPHLNVFQNIAFGLRREKLGKPELEKRVDEALAMIRLEGYGARAAHELSGGQRQRVALARALIKKPKVLLLDEPLGALDKKLREQMQLELRELQKSLGITFVFVTHDQEEALTMSDRIAVMSDGHVLEQGSPAELYSHPNTRFVAEFLGAMNLFEAVVKGREADDYVVDAERLGQVRIAAPDGKFAPGERVSVGLRPENIKISLKDDSKSAASLAGTVSTAAYLGDRTHLYVRTAASEEPIIVGVQNLDGASGPGTEASSDVFLSWSPGTVLLLKH